LLRVGLTGGIASGKSTVGEMLVNLGAHLIQADAIAHRLTQPGEEAYRQVVEHFGKDILNPDKTINRRRLAEVVFADPKENRPSRVEELNRIVHPAVLRAQEDWMEQVGRKDPDSMAIVEAALILEAGAADQFDRLVVVVCRPEQRVHRWASARHVDEETASREVIRRMAAQLPDEEKVKAADHVIDNSKSLEATRKQVNEVFQRLTLDMAASGRHKGQAGH